ncbi:TT1751-like protein [Cubamyces sp. BRFM 1775]|nr:TT1751-like protein [Cubamyces sp. BRFM 1775]
MSKTVVEYVAKRVTYHTDLPFEEVTTRLEKALNKPSAGPEVFRLINHAESKDELDGGLRAIVDGHEFIYFTELVHHRWLRLYASDSPNLKVPRAIVYTFGNPPIGQTILLRDVAAGLHVPPRMMVLENEDGTGTRVIYEDPATLNPVPGFPGDEVNEGVRRIAEGLSVKLDRFVRALLMAEK